MKLELESSALQTQPAASYASASRDEQHLYAEAENLIHSAIQSAKDGDVNAARQMFLRAVELDPLSEAAWLWLASISEYPEELIVFLQKVLAINPANERAVEWMRATENLLAKTFVQRGIKAAQENRTEFAAQCFRQAVAHDAANEMGWLWLASLTEAKAEKAEYLRRALAINPDNETACETLLDLESRSSQELLQLATSAAISGNREEAHRMLDEILAESPAMEEAWILQAYLAESFYKKMSAYEQVLSINPENEAAQAGLASMQAMQQARNSRPPVAASAIAETAELLPAENEQIAETLPATAEPETAETEAFAPEVAPALEYSDEMIERSDETPGDFFAPDAENPAAVFDSPAPADDDENAAEDFAGLVPDAEDSDHPTQELDAEVFETAEKVFARYGEPQNLVSGVAEETTPKTSFDETADETSDENFAPPETGLFFAYEQTSAQTEETNDADEDDFIRLLESDDAEAVELLDADRSTYDAPETPSAAEEAFFENDLFAEETLPPVAEFFGDSPVSNADEFSNSGEFSDAAIELPFAEDYSEPALTGASPEIAEPQFAEPAAFAAAETNYEAANAFQDYSSGETSPANPYVETAGESFGDFAAEAVETANCPFCSSPNEAQAIACRSCEAMLSLSDIESLIAHQTANPEVMLMAINDLEAEKLRRGLSVMQLTDLGIAYLNTGDLRKGLDALRDALHVTPNNVVLGAKVNYLAIRLAEIEAQDCKAADSAVGCKRIMVVDDSPTVRKLISGKLEKSGHTVVCAVDGMDALAKVGEQIPDLILLDINMPNMDGYQVCKMIRSKESTREIPIIMISGKDGFFDKVRGRMAGSTGYITKPFGPETLMRTLETYLN